jgi:hypothetical protein
MDYASYQMVSQNTDNLNTGSYLNRSDYSLFVKGFTSDLWYGLSANDVIELGIYDHAQNPIGWGVLNQEKKYKLRQYSYLNTLDSVVNYSYAELQPEFILYKNDKILVCPPQQVAQSFGIAVGSYVLTYNFARDMAGTPTSPLIVKEISPSRKEIKLVPVGSATPQYEAFCGKRILLGDVSPLYLQFTQNCPYGQIYSQVSPLYQSQINTLKSLFFLNTDGALINFLKNLYEDLIIYTNTPKDVDGNVTGDPERLLRIQGIRTYFSNYLRSNVNTISDFATIDTNYKVFVSASIERKFSPIGKNPVSEYVQAKIFVYDFFTKYFYQPITELLSSTFTEKYFSYLRNALNMGDGRLFPVINHDYLDERIEPTDPLTLIVKLQSELPSDVMANTHCWVSNISLVPYVVDSIIQSAGEGALLKIGPPNFSADLPQVSFGKINKSYTSEDLAHDSSIDRELAVSKKQAEINVDYSSFNNFVVFSSAEVRLKIFKNKMIQLSSLTSSLQGLEVKNITFLAASGSTYPYYTNEYGSLQGQMDEIIGGFDGYEANLYRGRNYQYIQGEFVSASYVEIMDTSASLYDRNNRDSLINNTPQHVLLDSDNDEYLVFLSMMGHFFDDLYVYIANLPSEKVVGEGDTDTFTRMVTDYMLEAFGWKMDDTLEQANVLNNFLTSDEVVGLNSMSAEDRVKTIRNRILLNLPQIYKAKGTENSVKMLLSCYGIPTTLLSIREYGGVDYTNETATYTQLERAYMYQWDTSSVFDQFRTSYPGAVKTIEYKFSIPDESSYEYNKKQIQWGVVGGGIVAGTVSGSGLIHGGFLREREKNMGKVFFSVGYKGFEDFTIYSDSIPIFDGNIYSVMVRKNDPDPFYQYSSNILEVPTKYDLYVQRNEAGRVVVKSTTSHMNYVSQSNYRFNNGNYLMIGGWFYSDNGRGYTGTFDKMMLWLDPVSDTNFEDHVNNINSYAFSGSRDGYKSLVYRMHTDYPFDLNRFPPGTVGDFGIGVSTRPWGQWYNANPYYAISSSCGDRFEIETGDVAGGNTNFAFLASWGAWSGSQKPVYDPITDCNISQSTYPYQFKIVDYPCTYAVSKYGPNKFRNEKIRHVSQSIAARFDIKERSTYSENKHIAPDSNLVGFFADPNDFKNKDILRYFGNFDFMDVIGSPTNMFSSNYDHLGVLRKKYADIGNYVSGSNPRVNEMMTLYRLYFNRSIFESIRNLTPARSNVLTGVLIEPTILERPKYESKAVFSEMNSGSAFYADITASRYFRDPNTKLVRISQSLVFAEFNDPYITGSTYFNTSSLPNNLYMDLDVSYINEPNFVYPLNYLNSGTDVSDFPDKYQLGHFEDGYAKMSLDMTVDSHPTGSERFYLLKQWDTYKIWAKTNEWNRTAVSSDNLYTTNSIQLYKYVIVTEDWFKSVVYTTPTDDTTTSEVLAGNGLFTHYPYTFKDTANQVRNNIRVEKEWNGTRFIFNPPYYTIGDGSCLEIVQGYPRNHYTHKRQVFSPNRFQWLGKEGKAITSGSYIRSQQTITSTINADGLEDGTIPVQSFDVSNVNLVQSDNVINQ